MKQKYFRMNNTQSCPWNPIEEAPKDTAVLLDIGLPWAVVGVWNEPSQAWCYTELKLDLYDGKWIDTYFENDYQPTFDKDKKVIKWFMYIPSVNNNLSIL